MMKGDKMMTNKSKDMDLNESTSSNITHINGVPIPKDLLDHLHKHNGGEGYLGERIREVIICITL